MNQSEVERPLLLSLLKVVILTVPVWACFRLLIPIFAITFPDAMGSQLSYTWAYDKFELVAILYFTSYTFIFSYIFKVIEKNLPGSKIQKGLLYGAVLGAIWYVGLIEVSIHFYAPLDFEAISAFGDVIPMLIFGLLCGLFLGTDNIKEPEIQQENSKWRIINFLSLFIFIFPGLVFRSLLGLVFTEPKSVAAMMLLIPFSISQYIYTIVVFLTIGILYYFIAPAIPGDSILKKNTYFSFAVFGVHWLVFQGFFLVFYSGVFTYGISLTLIDSVAIFLSANIYSRLIKNSRVSNYV
ncbi:MAG: hypothetical protein QNJ41_21460 [Xenococcaceae cyanobacterium MO_188.B32]|nr:hypothetical protein [Xenococcaceae cyanobacterium MO_188.B32]